MTVILTSRPRQMQAVLSQEVTLVDFFETASSLELSYLILLLVTFSILDFLNIYLRLRSRDCELVYSLSTDMYLTIAVCLK